MAKKPEKLDKPAKGKGEDEKVLETARKRFAAAADAEKENRENYIEDTDFSCSDDQWPEEVKKLRGKDRPMHTVNRLNGVVKQIIGDYRQNKLAMKVLPASDDASEEMAEILGGLLRNIEVQSNADMAYTNALDCSARGNIGYFRVLPEYASDDVFDQNLAIRPIHNPLTVYFDPSARLITREDAKWCFITDMVKKDELERQYPKAKLKSFEGDDAGDWCSGDELRVAEYFEKVTYEARLGAFSNGMVMEIVAEDELAALAAVGVTLLRERTSTRTKIVWRKMTHSEVLETREYKIPYIPVIPVLGEEVNVKGKVKLRSAIYYAKDAQRMYNYWKSAATESVALSSKAPWLLTAEQREGLEDQWDRVNSSPQPHLVYNHIEGQPMPQRIDPATVPIGELTMANGSSDDIKSTTGLYDASLGARGNETSGRAIMARQQEGDTATYLFIDNLKKAIEYCGRVLLAWVQIVYDAERVVRVLDLEGQPSTVTVNERKYDPMTGVTQILNSLTVGKYDLVITTGPSFASRKQEALASMTQLVQAYPPIMQAAPDLIIKSMDFPGANEIAERMKRTLPPELTTDPDSPEAQQAQQQAAQRQEMAMQVEQQKGETESLKAQAGMVKAQAEMAKARMPAVAPNAQQMRIQ